MAQTLFEREKSKGKRRRSTTLRPPAEPSQDVPLLRSPGPSAMLNDHARSALDWAFACDARLCLTQLSEGFTQMTGFLPAQWLGQPLEALLEFSGAEDAAAFMARLAGGQAIDRDVLIIKGAQRPIAVSLSVITITDETGALIGLEGGVNQIRQSAGNNASTLSEDGGNQLRFAHQVQHELRTPLNAIAGFAQIMREDLRTQADGRYAGYCDDILSASKHLLGLIDDMVAASGVPLAQDGLVPTDVDIGVVAQEVGRLLEPVAQTAGVDFAVDVPSGQDAGLTDRRKIKQIILNLAENAIKFTPREKSAGIRLQTDDDGTARQTIVVWDEGPGIAEEDQERIWQRFEKAGEENAFKSTSPGLGLGLSVVKTLADSIGARISLVSTVGEGSEFHIHLP